MEKGRARIGHDPTSQAISDTPITARSPAPCSRMRGRYRGPHTPGAPKARSTATRTCHCEEQSDEATSPVSSAIRYQAGAPSLRPGSANTAGQDAPRRRTHDRHNSPPYAGRAEGAQHRHAHLSLRGAKRRSNLSGLLRDSLPGRCPSPRAPVARTPQATDASSPPHARSQQLAPIRRARRRRAAPPRAPVIARSKATKQPLRSPPRFATRPEPPLWDPVARTPQGTDAPRRRTHDRHQLAPKRRARRRRAAPPRAPVIARSTATKQPHRLLRDSLPGRCPLSETR